MKKVFNIIQWLVFAAVLAVVLWVTTRPAPTVSYWPETWSNWSGFMAISYAGVTRDDSAVYPSSQTLIEHLNVLKEAGFNTITTADALAFMEHRAPLPDKALLILFEGARKETMIRAHPALRRQGMQATLCIPTESLESWDESRLKERDVRKISRMPQWSLAAMGNDAVNPIVVSETEVTDHFLSTRKWLPKLKRVENDSEFRQRISDDYDFSASLLAKLNGSPVPAYVYPFADDGRRVGADPQAAAINYTCVTSRYSMAFVSAMNPYNPPGRNRYALSRLRVNGDWTAGQLLAALNQAQPLSAPVGGVEGAKQWTFLNGARVAQQALVLDSEDAGWLKGSELWTDVEIQADLALAHGATVACYARFLRPSDCVRLSIGSQGIRLQESRAGIPVTLATAPAPTGQVMRLVWRIKGIRSWLSLDGVPVFGPVPLGEPRPSGSIGFESYFGKASLSNLKATPIQRTGIMAASWADVSERSRAGLMAYLPLFPPLDEALPPRHVLDYIQAVSEGASVWPILSTKGQVALTEEAVAALDARLAKQDVRPFIKGFVLDSTQTGCADWLRARGFGVMHRVRAGEAMPLGATNRVDFVWLEGSGSNVAFAAQEFLHRHPPSQLMVQDKDVIGRHPGVGQIVDREEGGRP